jgi:FkbM family methyltransferase
MVKLIGTPKHSDLIYDVGMHKGEDSEYYLRKGFRVVGFEADPELVAHCGQRLKDFVNRGQLVIIEGAIVSPDVIREGRGKVRFYKNEAMSVWGTACVNWAERNVQLGAPSSTIEVAAVNFADVMKERGVPHYIKIDIEGSDMVCINTLADFEERPDYISLESDKTSFVSIRREIDLLGDLGYDCFQAIEQSAIPFSQSPPNPPREGSYVAHRFEEGASGLFGAELSDSWKSRRDILRRYRAIRLGYYLLGDRGILKGLDFRGAERLKSWSQRFVSRLLDGSAVPGWYDTHARHKHARRAEGGGAAGGAAL